jgi:hypothetical protein
MTSSVIAELLLRNPFQRFVLQSSDNDDQDIRIDDPAEVEHDRDSEILIVKQTNGREIIVDLRLVARVDELAPGER